MIVGDLLSDMEAQSFASVEDADAYLAPEAREAWETATLAQKEAALVVASRWLLTTIPWTVDYLSGDDPVRVAHVAARVAVEALSRDLMAPVDRQSQVIRERVGPIEVEYRDTATGLVWPWLRPMLGGLAGSGGGAMRIVRS